MNILTPEMLLRAYAIGVFPMADSRDSASLFWVNPETRGIIPLDDFHVPRSLCKTLRRGLFEVRCDTDFDRVVAGCAAPGPGRAETWINAPIAALCSELFASGFAHSVECRRDGELVGGLVEETIATRFGLTGEERGLMLPSGKQRVLHNRLHWAKFYLTKAGLLESPKRGRFVISSAGRKVLANPPEKLDNQFLLTFPAFREFYRSGDNQEVSGSDGATAAPANTPEEVIEAAYTVLRGALRADLLDRILQNSPSFFERVIIDLLVAMGYGGSHRDTAEQLGRSGDGGVDGVVNEDVLGLDRVYVQAKRYGPGTTVGRPEIQAFTGSLVGLGASKGVFVTTSTFSAQAIEFVSRIPQRVILIDGKRLTELMIEHTVGVRASRTLEFKRIDEDFFSEE